MGRPRGAAVAGQAATREKSCHGATEEKTAPPLQDLRGEQVWGGGSCSSREDREDRWDEGECQQQTLTLESPSLALWLSLLSHTGFLALRTKLVSTSPASSSTILCHAYPYMSEPDRRHSLPPR